MEFNYIIVVDVLGISILVRNTTPRKHTSGRLISKFNIVATYDRLLPCSGGSFFTHFVVLNVSIFFLNRFGFHNTSSIDSLLDKEDVSLEAILDEDDLLQECKSQNTRLIDYFQRVDVLKRLLGYVTGEIEGEEESRRFK